MNNPIKVFNVHLVLIADEGLKGLNFFLATYALRSQNSEAINRYKRTFGYWSWPLKERRAKIKVKGLSNKHGAEKGKAELCMLNLSK